MDGNENVIVAGYSNWIDGRSDYTTIKYTTNGNQLWIKRYDGTAHSWDEANSIAVDAAGDVYVTSTSISDSDPHYYDYATGKYDTNGGQKWVSSYHGTVPSRGLDKAIGIAVDNQKNVYITGSSDGNSTGTDIATIKYVQP